MPKAWRQDCRWDICAAWPGRLDMARRLRLSPLIAQVLHNRGLEADDPVRRFLSPKLTDLHPPELLHDVDAAAGRIAQAVRQGEKICLYGDYDVDGMTGVAILFRCLALHGATPEYYVPHRLEEGYGVNVAAVEKIAAGGARLLVTIDCGISALEPLRRARELGMEVIVTDHHAPGASLPEALAVVHPGVGGAYPNPDLSGAGVAFKLAWQLARRMCGRERVDEPTREFLLEATSLAALGTIADVVPLTGENRVLAVYGLRGLAATRHAGIRALLASANLTGENLDAYHVGFLLAPRLNACGRMGHARLAVELLARADADRCRRIAQHLERQNAQRQKVEREILEQALAMVESGAAPGGTERSIVLASEHWHAGVVGIVAARLVDRYHRPAVVIALHGQEGQGSARSIAGFHMHQALAECGELLTSFGGHAMAAGLRLPAGAVEDFARAFAECARRRIAPEALRPSLRIDAEAAAGELTRPVAEHLHRLAPFGHGNPPVRVALRGCRVLSPPTRMGRNGQTVSFVVAQNAPGAASARLRCVGFNMGELPDRLAGVNTLDLAGEPVLNHFNGQTSVELRLADVAW